MSQASLFSPSTASAGFSDPLEARPFTPDAATARVHKQVVRINAQSDGALVNIYIRMTVPRSNVTQTVPLFSDEGITLKTSHVFPIAVGKAGRPILPHDASRRLQMAAEVLSLRCATSPVASPAVNGSDRPFQGWNQGEAPAKRKPKITISNFQVSLLVPSDAEAPPSESRDEQRLSYIAVIQLGIPFTLRPPKWPFMIHVPVARCLNNQLQFSRDGSCVDEDTVLEADPPLLLQPARTPLSRQNSSSESPYIKESDEVQSSSGPFASTSALSIRWARADAGKNKEGTSISGYPQISANLLEAFTFFSGPKKIDESSAEIVVEAEARLIDPSHAGSDATVSLNLDLVGADWISDSISVLPAASSTASFQSFSTTIATKTSVHSIRASTSAQNGNNGESIDGGNVSDEGLQDEPDATFDEGGTILNARPPKGFSSSHFGPSSDSEEELTDVSPSKGRGFLRRRCSLGKAAHLTSLQDQPDLPYRQHHGDAKTIFVLLKTSSLWQSKDDFCFSVRGRAKVKVHSNNGKRAVVELPFLKAQNIALHHRASVRDVECQIVEHDKLIEMRDGGRDAAHSLDIPADFDNRRMDKTLASLKWHANEAKAREQKPPLAGALDDSDSLETFVNTSFYTEKNHSDTHSLAAQVESLSGVIQQASADVRVSLVGQKASSLDETLSDKLEATHVIRSTWPSTPAPQSVWLPSMGFAIPCEDESDVRVLYAGVNGISVDYEAKGGQMSSKETRIVELQLPAAMRQAVRLDVSLIYTLAFSTASSLCVLPPVASSVAELSITLDYKILASLLPTISFTPSPLCHSESIREEEGTAAARATMLPSMAKVAITFAQKPPKTAVLIAPLKTTSIPKASTRPATSKARWLFNAITVLHILCTIGLLLGSFVAWHVFEPLLDLPWKVNALALATDVDLRDGTARPGAGIFEFPDGWESGPDAKWAPIAAYRSQRLYTTPATKKVRASIIETTAKEPTKDLSTETRSFMEILQSLSANLASTLVWPLRLLYSLFYVA